MTKNKNNMSIVKSTPDILSLLRSELDGLQAISATQYKTNGKVDGFPNTIETETKIENLIRMWASIKGRANAYTDAQVDLGIKTAPQFKLNGSTIEDFKHDIELKIQILTHSERKAELEALVKEAEGFLTKEDQFALFQQKLKSVLSK